MATLNGSEDGGHSAAPPHFWKLALGSVGVVYGDIGTSPLYALREALHQASKDGILGESEVIGIVSLLVWTLILIVTLKYVVLMLRADNRGEGGTLSLLALAQRAVGRRTPVLLGLGIAGAALFYGDAAITPAISVLSAVEGLKLVTPVLEPYVLPITLLILIALFWVQSRGTERVAAYFGPVTLVWFMVLAALGLLHAFDRPVIFLWPKLAPVLSGYPDINVEIICDYALADIVADRFDAGVRLGEHVDKDMISMRLGPDFRLLLVASPAYFEHRAPPEAPQDLTQHACINLRLPTHGGVFTLTLRNGSREVNVRTEGRVTFNTVSMMRSAALQGFGIGCFAEDIVSDDIKAGRLVRVLQDWCPPVPGYHLYYPSRRQHAPAFALILEALRYRGGGTAPNDGH